MEKGRTTGLCLFFLKDENIDMADRCVFFRSTKDDYNGGYVLLVGEVKSISKIPMSADQNFPISSTGGGGEGQLVNPKRLFALLLEDVKSTKEIRIPVCAD